MKIITSDTVLSAQVASSRHKAGLRLDMTDPVTEWCDLVVREADVPSVEELEDERIHREVMEHARRSARLAHEELAALSDLLGE